MAPVKPKEPIPNKSTTTNKPASTTSPAKPPKNASTTAKKSNSISKAQASKSSITSSTSKTSNNKVKTGNAGSKTKKGQLEEPAGSNSKVTPEEIAAVKIQTRIRNFLAKKKLERIKKEKIEYEAEMEKLEKEAFLHLIKLEQEEAERKRLKEEKEKKRKLEENRRKKRMLEAAFDGDVKVLKQVLSEVAEQCDEDGISNDTIGKALRSKRLGDIIECEDANGNTALSEAANGGHADAIKFLLDKGADPNTQGQFRRTPLYRSAFAGHLAAVQVLLENGADPRIYASDNQCPAEVAATTAIQEIITNWDINQTESILVKLQAAKEKRIEEDRKRKEAEKNKLENVVEKAKKEYEGKQKMLDYAYRELNKRIKEHDLCILNGFDRPEITLQSIHSQEQEVETLQMEVASARDHLAKVRLQLREATAGEGEEAEDKLPGVKVNIKELDDVLFRDTGNKIFQSGKWPLLIDTSGQASTFLRYRDTNYVNAVRPADMEPNNIRLSLLGAIRYGKPLVLDMMEVDMFDTCTDCFDSVMKNLMDIILDKSILREEIYTKLIKEKDGPEYDRTKFSDIRMANFKFVLLTKNPFPDDKLTEKFYVIRIVINV